MASDSVQARAAQAELTARYDLVDSDKCDVIVALATDIAARGIHVDGIDQVVHFDPPAEPKAYLHRSGRTARAGAAGTVVTLALPEQTSEVAKLHRRAQVTTSPLPTGQQLRPTTDRQPPRRRRRRREVAAS